MKKNINIIILFFVIISIIIVSFLVVENIGVNNQRYNDNVLSFTLELIKGEKSLEDIDKMEVSQNVKETWFEYYNKHFYKDNDKILMYESVDELDFILNEYLNDRELCYVDGIFDFESFHSIFLEKIVNSTSSTINGIEKYKFYDLYSNPVLTKNDVLNTDENLIIENNNIYYPVSKISGYDEYIYSYYKGIRLEVYHDGLDKHIRDYRSKSESFNTIGIESIYEEDAFIIYKIRDELNNSFDIKVKKRFGKIQDIIMDI